MTVSHEQPYRRRQIIDIQPPSRERRSPPRPAAPPTRPAYSDLPGPLRSGIGERYRDKLEREEDRERRRG